MAGFVKCYRLLSHSLLVFLQTSVAFRVTLSLLYLLLGLVTRKNGIQGQAGSDVLHLVTDCKRGACSKLHGSDIHDSKAENFP